MSHWANSGNVKSTNNGAIVMGCLHDPANVQQTSSKCIQNTPANAERLLDRVNALWPLATTGDRCDIRVHASLSSFFLCQQTTCRRHTQRPFSILRPTTLMQLKWHSIGIHCSRFPEMTNSLETVCCWFSRICSSFRMQSPSSLSIEYRWFVAHWSHNH